MLEEHILLLGENGFSVELYGLDALEGVRVETDAPKMVRIIDNIFSNLYKYSAQSDPVKIGLSIEEGSVKLVFENKIKHSSDDVESTGIGLKTCSKIAALLGVGFEYAQEDGYHRTFITVSTLQGVQKAEKERNL